MKRYFLLMLIAGALGLVAVAAPFAVARPSSAVSCSSPTLIGPAQAHVGETYTVNGCGFAPGSVVPLEIAEADGCCIALNMVADQSGRFSYAGDVWAAGTYTVRAAVLRNGTGRWRVAASWSFEAYQ